MGVRNEFLFDTGYISDLQTIYSNITSKTERAFKMAKYQTHKSRKRFTARSSNCEASENDFDGCSRFDCDIKSFSDFSDTIDFVADGGGSIDPAINNSLRIAIEEALKRNIPKGSIQAALKRLSESKGKEESKRLLFEYRLYKKLLVIVTIFTDRVAHVRIQMATPMKKHLAEVANIKRSFIERGVFNVIARPDIKIDNLEYECLSDAIEFGAEDIEVHDIDEKQVTFFSDPNHFFKVKQKLIAAGYQIEYSECDFFPTIPLVELTESEQADYNKFKGRLMSIEGFDEIYDNLKDDESE